MKPSLIMGWGWQAWGVKHFWTKRGVGGGVKKIGPLLGDSALFQCLNELPAGSIIYFNTIAARRLFP